MAEEKKTIKEEEKKQEVKNVAKKEDKDINPEEKKESTEKKPGFLQAVGKRKTSVARVKVFKNGSGKMTVNGKDAKDYFGNDFLVEIALGALNNVSQLKKLDVSAKVEGGGKKGQAEAIRLGTSKCLLELNPVFKKNLRKAGYLTRDPRKKERKKPGLKKARRAPQWSKR